MSDSVIASSDTIKEVKTTCAYCGVGCGIEASVNKQTREITVKGDELHPANHGRLCSKGSSLGETIGLQTRLLSPQVNQQTVSWDVALDTVANQFLQVIEEHGPDAVAFYGSGQLLTEDYYVANKLMKGFIGSANIDTNSRLCMSSAVTGHKRAFGSDTVPNCYEDLDQAELFVLIGSNTAWCHPIAFQRIRAAKERNPDIKVVVIDPRRTQTCDLADLHLPIASGTDVLLFNGLLSYLSRHDAVDHGYLEDYTEGFDAALSSADTDAGDLDSVASRCGLNAEDLESFYQWFAATDKTLSIYSQGVKQSSCGADKVNAIINCHLATGRIGKPGSGPLSMTGQPNAMGGREVGGLANQLAAHMEFGHAGDIERVARFWNTDTIATEAGLAAVELFDAVHSGKIKAIWIMATNPVVSMPNADKVKEALKLCNFVVVSDCVAQTDTMQLANVKLPALGWSEKDGTVTNSERRISHQRALLPPAGEAKPDWWIVSQVAQRMGYQEAFDYQHPVEIFREHAALSGFENNALQRPRDFDISAFANISLDDYANLKPIQWPVSKASPAGRQRFFEKGGFFTANQKGQFVAVTGKAPVNSTSRQYPLVLNTGRLRDQWHTMTRSALSPRLNQHRPEPFVEVHPEDAQRNGLIHGNIAHIRSQWGQMYARVQVTDNQRLGDVFVPMHWTEQYASNGRMGALVNPVVDPLSGQPESKHTPVAIRPFVASWYGFILSRQPLDNADQLEYQVTVNGDGYYRYELAGIKPPANWRQLLGADLDAEHQEYSDEGMGIYRAAGYQSNSSKLEYTICIARKPTVDQLPERGWLSTLFAKDSLCAEERMALLSGLPTIGTEDAGVQICACFNVGEKTILKAIKQNDLSTHQQVGECCKAGTNCGSCVPEIKALIQSSLGGSDA